jgi:light-regulated signal transduction histidine kinase (bacteriophytochrome)
MNAISDTVIALACFAIPFVLAYVSRRRKDLPHNWLILSFGIGVAACGAMHLLAVWNIWHAEYWIEGIFKILTAASAIPTAILLWRYLPELLSLPSQRQLQNANERLASANRELEAFTASVSHDLRSPLTTIAGQAGLLELSLGNVANEDQKRRLHRIQGSVKQMSELIDALLVLSRISRHTLRRELVDVSALIDTVVSDLRQRDPLRQIEVKVQPGMSVHGDRRLISDLFTNVLSNAWKFTSKIAAAHVEIGQKVEGSMSTLFVRDNGAGFDMAYASKLFKPFQRLHSPTEFEGSGVGLATVARIVDRHGGKIWAEARPNQGAVFYFTLPTLPFTDEIPVQPPASAVSQPAR